MKMRSGRDSNRESMILISLANNKKHVKLD